MRYIIVDDSELTAAMASELLEGAGAEVTCT